ncbi:MAG: MASE4 domain-containing protein [Casimicrobiaceae bacterium]
MIARDLTDGRPLFLPTLPAGRRERRIALAVAALSFVIFAAAAPFAKVPLAPIGAFIPSYESALTVNDLVTAVLLFGQFSFLRSRALLVLASGYLFTALIAVAHALTFPGLFAPDGLLGAGPQSTAWLYMFWHGVFPLCVISYALLNGRGRAPIPVRHRRAAILGGIAAAAIAACGLAYLATTGQQSLPAIMQGNHYTPAMTAVVASVWILSVVALVALWRRRPHTVLDVWLMVVMCAWIFDIALSAVLNGGRFDLGFYAGRIYGLLASTFVLLVLVLENGALYGRLVEGHDKHRRRLQILHEIDQAVAGEESPEVIAGAVIQPLREVLGVARAVVNIFDLAAGEAEWLAAAGRRRTHVGSGVRFPIRLVGDVEALARGEPQLIDTRALPASPEVDALLASGVKVYMAMPMIAGGQLIGAISFGGESGPFTAEQMSIAREVATQLAIAVSQARLYDRVKRHAEELELRVRARTVELETANKELDAFSYSVSHDLRAPLRAVDGYARMLEEDYGGRLDAEGNRLLGVVRSSSRQMGRLIDDLLAFARLGREQLRTRPLQLDDLVNQVIDETRPAHDGRKIEFVVGNLGSADADPALLKQALENLLTNAIKFTRDKNPAIIEVGSQGNGDGDEMNTYYVKDNGAGFDMKYYDKLFGVFQRLHSSAEYPGTGVGLAIVQRVIHRHGGRVWAESTLGQGTTFFFTLRDDACGVTAPAGPAAASGIGGAH